MSRRARSICFEISMCWLPILGLFDSPIDAAHGSRRLLPADVRVPLPERRARRSAGVMSEMRVITHRICHFQSDRELVQSGAVATLLCCVRRVLVRRPT